MKFAYEETGASVKNDKDMEKLNQMDTDGVNFRHQKQKEKAKRFSYEEAKKKKEAKQHSKKAQVYRANEGEAPGKKNSKKKIKIRKKQNLLGCHTTMITRNVWKI